MKYAIIVMAAVVLSACSKSANPELKELEVKRDSLQIALLDSSINPDDAKIIKKITMQKNRIAATQLKIKGLEAELTPQHDDNLTPVAVKVIKGEPFNHYIIVYGKVEADHFAQISPEIGGRIETIHVEEGQQVSKGTLLISMNTDATEKQIKGVKSSLELATSTYEKQSTLWEKGIGSEIQYLNAKSTKESLEAQLETLEAQLRMTQIRAPFNGTVDKILLKEGELASPGFPVVEFVNLNGITIKADVPEKFIDNVKVGQNVELSFEALPNYLVKTPIVRVSKVIDPSSRTFEIEVRIKNTGEKVKPNMVSSIKINDFSSENAFVVPSLVVRKDISGNYVYTIKEKDGQKVVGKQYITAGMVYEDESMVTKGLNEGDRVIIKGFHLVSSGMPVKIVN
jgi:RND family efflux transporter MFP subunit